MDVNNLPQHVQDWMQEIEKNVVANNDRMMEFCDKLEHYADEHNEGFLKGFSLFFRGFNRYLNARLEQGMEDLSAALNYLISAQAWGMVAHTYNSMGNIAYFQGDISLAIDCYIKGLSLVKEYDIKVIEYNIRTNIANVYIGLGAYESAVNMLLECERLLENGLVMTDNPQLAAMGNLTNCYIHLGELEKAEECLKWIRKKCEEAPVAMTYLLIYILETQLYHMSGNIEARDAAIANLEKLELQSMDVYDAINELYRHCMLLLEIGKIDEFLSLVNRIEMLAKSPNAEKQILDLRLTYYKKIGDKENLAKMAVKYYEVAEQREIERNKIVSHNIITRMSLDEEERRRKEIEISNLMLKQKSERDALTGMSNRYKFNELAELAFHRAYLNGTPLTVEILDIDCYKEFNDNYGHQAGDECLVRIADAIRSMEEYNGVHTARYGGDEFVILFEEYSRKDVEKMVLRLKDKIHSLNIPHAGSKVSTRVTISQGLFHKIPSGGNKLWDFLYGADMALYAVKNRGKNNYYIGTAFDEVRRYSKGETT